MVSLTSVRAAILVRHGESEANVRQILSCDINGYPLTTRGTRQVEFAARQLAGLRVSRLLTSPIQRAVETASIIAKHTGLTPEIEAGITESGMGPYNNVHMSGLPPGSREELGMEPWESHVARFREVLESLDSTTILVSHGMPIRAAISSYLGLDEVESFGIEIRNASISVINLDSGTILSVGSLLVSQRIKDMLK